MLVTLGEEGTLQQRVYSGLRHAILEGRLRTGSRLPSTRLLARELGVSRNTALLAYEQLLGEGYVVARAGSGTYVAPQVPDAMLTARAVGAAAPARPAAAPRLSAYARRALAADPLSVPGARSGGAALRYDFRYGNLSVGEFPHETWRRLVARRARRLTPRSLAYAAPYGHGPLREAIAAYVRRARAVACRPEQVVVVDGSQQGLDLVARVLLDPGDLVVVEDPQYQGARKVFAAAGARIATVPVDAEGADVSALLADGRQARLAYVTPSHQFPTGATMSLARRLTLLAWAERAGAYVIEDDYDSEFRYEGRPVEAVQGLDRHGRVIYLGTFSKVLFPALRIGYVVLPDPLVEPFVAAKWLADRQTATFEQEVLADFIGEGHFERHLRRTRAGNAARRAALLGALRDCVGDRVRVEGANAGVHLLAWLAGAPAAQAERVAARAAEVGVGVYPIAPYYVAPPPEAGLLLGYAALSEREIREGIRLLAGVVPRG